MDKRYLIKEHFDDIVNNDEETFKRWTAIARFYLNKKPKLLKIYDASDIIDEVYKKLISGEWKWDQKKFPDFAMFVGYRIKGFVSNEAIKKINKTESIEKSEEEDEGRMPFDEVYYEHNCITDSIKVVENKLTSKIEFDQLMNKYSKNSNERRLLDLKYEGYSKSEILKKMKWKIGRYNYLMRKIKNENSNKKTKGGKQHYESQGDSKNEKESDPIKCKSRPDGIYS